MSRRETALGIATSILSVLITLLLAEVTLRFFPVTSGLRSVAVTPSQPLLHFTPNRPFVHSFDWNMHTVNRGRVNNAGFVNDQDYCRDDALPLLAVIGDSMIEAQMVPYAQTMQGRLASALAGTLRVYSFAAAGAPLSQYLIFARHAVREFGARAVVINVVSNDYDESHVGYKLGPGFWLYHPDGEQLSLKLIEHRPGWGTALVRQSALARYLVINLQLNRHLFDIGALGRWVLGASPAKAQSRYAGNTAADTSPARVSHSLAALDAFFRDLPDMVGLPIDRVLFTVDGFRTPKAAAEGAGTYFDLMRLAFLAKAEAHGYEVIDLDPLFHARHRQSGEQFQFPWDSHWDGRGHAVAAEAVFSSRLLARLRQ